MVQSGSWLTGMQVKRPCSQVVTSNGTQAKNPLEGINRHGAGTWESPVLILTPASGVAADKLLEITYFTLGSATLST